MFILHQSNRTELLLSRLLEVLARPLGQVFSPETILVQSQGMARWLALELARAQGVCANLDCPFPAAFLWRLMQAAAAIETTASPYEPRVLRWSLLGLMARLRGEPGFEPVSGYLRGEGAELKAYHLSGRLAGLLDQYLVYRPDWIRDWSAGRDSHWQARLWRQVVERHGRKHRVALHERLAAVLTDDTAWQGLRLPERLCLFGIPALAASHLELFSLLARRIEVHLFLLSPSPEFWGDLMSRRQVVGAELRHGEREPAADLHLEAGCPLLMGLGGLGRDFQTLVADFDPQVGIEDFVDPGPGTVLGLLQSDLLAALDPGPLPPTAQPPAADRSLTIHSAHSPLREVEILRDQLLDLLDRHPGLEAGDILVMVPEIATYAPLVEAVFADPAEEGPRLPLAIADRASLSPLAKAFFDLLALLDSRAPVSQVLALLEQGPVRRAYDLSLDDLDLIRAWLRQANVNWGLSAEHRARCGLPAEAIGTWQTGLDSLLLGLLAPLGDRLLYGLLPCDCLEAGQGRVLARLLNFCEALDGLARAAVAPRSLAAWRELLVQALDSFLGPEEGEQAEMQAIRQGLDDLAQAAATAAFEGAVGLAVLRAALAERLAPTMGNFVPGRLTFCQLVPMRSIPFRVICLLGMNDTSFPRPERPLGFDLMAQEPRPGDRSRRADDRYLFLETILSARDALYLSYVGQNSANAPVPPSVVISDLLDHLGRRLGLRPEACAARFVVRHPLQPFSGRYFAGHDQLFSFSRQNREIALAQSLPAAAYGGLLSGQPLPGPEAREMVELDDLIRFVAHPVRFLLRERLGLWLDDSRTAGLRDRERFSLDSLEDYRLRGLLIERRLRLLEGDYGPIAQARGEVGPGASGRLQLAACEEAAGAFAERLRALRGEQPLPPLPVRLELGDGRINGTLTGLWPTGQYLYRPGKLQSKNLGDLASLWVRHLVLCLLRPEMELSSVFVYQDGLWRYDFLPEAEARLRELLGLYLYGQATAVPLLPRASLAYAERRWGRRPESDEQALAQARLVWEEGDFPRGPERLDPYLAAAYGDRDPLAAGGDHDFCEVAALVLAPMIALGVKE